MGCFNGISLGREYMTNDLIDEKPQKWMIITWRHIDHEDAPYGRLLQVVIATKDFAEIAARQYVPHYSPVGIVREIV